MAITKVVFQLPTVGTFFENIAVRADGTLLVTRVDAPEVWQIDPVTGQGSRLLSLPSPLTCTTGIAELAPDVFALGAGGYDIAAGGPVAGSMEFWTFDLSRGEAQSTLRHVCAVPDAVLLNGLCRWDDTCALGVDSGTGTIYKADISRNTCEVVLRGEELAAPTPDAPVPIGINGVKVKDNQIYFTNSTRMTLYRLPVDPHTARPTGPVEAVATGFMCDDFAFDDQDGSAYITTHATHMVVRVTPPAETNDTTAATVTTVAGSPDSLELGGCTACAFGRGAADRRTLYVTTSGALSFPVDGKSEPAKVVAVQL